MIPDKLTHIVTKKNVYVILSLILLIVILVIVHNMYKKHLAKQTWHLLFNALLSKGLINKDITSDPIGMMEIETKLIDHMLKKYNIIMLYKTSRMSDEEVATIMLKLKK